MIEAAIAEARRGGGEAGRGRRSPPRAQATAPQSAPPRASSSEDAVRGLLCSDGSGGEGGRAGGARTGDGPANEGRKEAGDVWEFVRASQWLGGAVMDFKGGDRVVMFEGAGAGGGAGVRGTKAGAALAVLEMWAVATLSAAAVVTEQSSFILPAAAMYPKTIAAFAVRSSTNGTGRGHSLECYELNAGGEPSCTSAAGRYACS